MNEDRPPPDGMEMEETTETSKINDDYSPEDRQTETAKTQAEKIKVLSKSKQLEDDFYENPRTLGRLLEKNNLPTSVPQVLNMNKQKTSDMRPPSYNEAVHLIKTPTSVPQLNMTKKETVDVNPPPYEAAVANKYADFNLTLQQDVSRVLERTERIEQTIDVVVKGHDQLRDHFQRESIENRHRQEEHQRNVTRSFEALNTKLDTVIHRIPGPRDDVHDESDQNEMSRRWPLDKSFEDNVGLEHHTGGELSCLHNCQTCQCSQCQCHCHRGHSNRRKTKSNKMGHGSSSKDDPVHDGVCRKKTSIKGRQLVCGGNPGGSSDNPSDSTDDDMTREGKWRDRKRHRGKPKRDRGDKSDSDAFGMTGNNAEKEHNALMDRLEKYKKDEQRRLKSEDRQLVGACGGNPGGSSNDPSDDSDDSKNHRVKKGQGRQGTPTWSIDSTAWEICINSGNTDMIVDLLRKKKLPDKNLLIDACKVFTLAFRRLICDGICMFIVQKSKHIIYVYPANKINESTKKPDACHITFVVFVAKNTDLGNDFEFLTKNTTDSPSQENAEIRNCEKEETRIMQDENYPEAMRIKCIQKHSKSLRNDHTNLCRISNSRFRFDKAQCCVTQSPCITLYVYAKGLIPLGENLLPTELTIEDCPVAVPVDVREGFVEVYTGNQGPCDTLENLRMGCSIGVEPCMNENPVNGTLGGFFEHGGRDFCISSAHVFLSANEMGRLRTTKTPLLKRNNCSKPVYQPHNNYHTSFGEGRIAIYAEGGNGQAGVDVISILIENRNPKTGEFPKMDGDQEPDKKYYHGKVYSSEQIHNAFETDNNRCIYKYGCGTGWTKSTYRTKGASCLAPHPVQDGNTDFKICLHNQFEVYNDTDNAFAGKSDSGALVFMEDDDELVAIGMVVAGMAGEVCFVTPLDEIFKALRLDLKKGLKEFASSNVPIETNDLSYHQVNETVNELQDDMSNVKTEVASIKDNMIDMKTDITDVKNNIEGVKGEMKVMKEENSRGFAEILRLLQNNQHNNNVNS